MYWLLSIDAVARIALAIVLLFVVVPALARPRARASTLLERFFWNFGVGIILITVVGQITSLANLYSLVTVLAGATLVILIGRSRDRGMPLWSMVKRSAENAFLALLNIFDGRVNLRRRIRRGWRDVTRNLRARTADSVVRWQMAGWIALTLIAAAFRFYRPFATANLGYSDTYAHFYILKLLEEGQQVDPAWGPYPRGLQFILMTIRELTNVDEILLMNFFGAFVGVLMTLSIADAARRISKSVTAGLLAGFLFATLAGGAGQYFILGGAFGAEDQSLAKSLTSLPYADIVAQNAGEFDLALTAFQRQTSTLPQELAMVLLFPAALFLFDYFRTRDRWHFVGFLGCTAAISAVHSGVVIPLIFMCAVMLVAAAIHRAIRAGTTSRAILGGALAVIVGCGWMLAFIAYPYTGGKGHPGLDTDVPGAALFYFPFLRPLAGSAAPADNTTIFVAFTPFLAFCIGAAVVLIVLSFIDGAVAGEGALRMWIALTFLLFLTMHFASRLHIPQIVEIARNSQWFLMSIVVLLAVTAAEARLLARFAPSAAVLRAATAAASIAIVIVWTLGVPRLYENTMRDRLLNYSGYGGAAFAVLEIERGFEPYTWTIVSYGQEFPMVLRRGFHLPAVDFLDRYDPAGPVLPIPTRSVFVIVEKTPHPFEINTWSVRFRRADIEQRLLTWMQVYQVTHRNLRVFFEDDHVRVYRIDRTPQEIAAIARQVGQ